MDKRDILENDIRVTVLGENGKYTFDWIDQEKRIIEYIPKDSDFDDYTDEVESLLHKQGLSIQSDDVDNTEDNTAQTNKTTSDTEFETEDPKIDESFDPVSNTTDSKTNDTSDTTVNDTHEEQEETKESETVTFMVRMSEAEERRKVIDNIRDKYPNASNKLELTGPYEVEYRITEDDELELVNVKDLGINQDTK